MGLIEFCHLWATGSGRVGAQEVPTYGCGQKPPWEPLPSHGQPQSSRAPTASAGRCGLQIPHPEAWMHHPVIATWTGIGAALSPHSYPTTTSAWLSCPCCTVSCLVSITAFCLAQEHLPPSDKHQFSLPITPLLLAPRIWVSFTAGSLAPGGACIPDKTSRQEERRIWHSPSLHIGTSAVE